MDSSQHRLGVTSTAAGLLYECDDGCGRRLAVDRRTGTLTVIDRGDQFARHGGTVGGVDIAPVVVDQP